MLVIKNDNYILHAPRWNFILGEDTYTTRDVLKRVEVIREHLENDARFHFINSKKFPESCLSKIHPYHDFIKKSAKSLASETAELYPDLFPGAGAELSRKSTSPLWAGLYCVDAVTPILKHTYDVAKGSAECALTGADLLVQGKIQQVYALCRPPGHHAGPRVFGGYCYFNNCAAAAEQLSKTGKTAILDIDFHHGNGTQEFFYERNDVFTCSIHGDPVYEYPYFWGYEEETGNGKGKKYNLNIPLPLEIKGQTYYKAVDRAVDAIAQYNPDFLVVAAGFDTHDTDPVGRFALVEKDYPIIGEKLAALNIPTLICQEGGYNTDVLGNSVYGFLSGFLLRR